MKTDELLKVTIEKLQSDFNTYKALQKQLLDTLWIDDTGEICLSDRVGELHRELSIYADAVTRDRREVKQLRKEIQNDRQI